MTAASLNFVSLDERQCSVSAMKEKKRNGFNYSVRQLCWKDNFLGKAVCALFFSIKSFNKKCIAQQQIIPSEKRRNKNIVFQTHGEWLFFFCFFMDTINFHHNFEIFIKCVSLRATHYNYFVNASSMPFHAIYISITQTKLYPTSWFQWIQYSNSNIIKINDFRNI